MIERVSLTSSSVAIVPPLSRQSVDASQPRHRDAVSAGRLALSVVIVGALSTGVAAGWIGRSLAFASAEPVRL